MQSDRSQSRYTSLGILAAYLQAEWGDILFGPDIPCEVYSFAGSETFAESRGDFYRSVADHVQTWAAQRLTTAPDNICDIGGATGRTLYELALRKLGQKERVLAEPSEVFCTWAKRLLSGEPFDGWTPVPLYIDKVEYKLVPADRLPTPIVPITIYPLLAGSVPRTPGYFDLVTCFNVVDRVTEPTELVKQVGDLVRPGGLMILASPLQFDTDFTEPSRWVRDLRKLVDKGEWTVVGTVDLPYDFGYYNRRFIRFITQVVAFEKNPDSVS